MTNLKNVLIIGAEVQPIPPVDGGAVELLVDYLIQNNEENKFVDLSVVSPYSKKAFEFSKYYKNTEFVFINTDNNLLSDIYTFVDLFFRKYFDKTTGILYLHKLTKYLKKSHFDLVIVENRPLFGKYIRRAYDGKLVLHLHNDFINNKTKHKKEILAHFDEYLVVSKYIENRVKEVVNKKTFLLYNGIDLTSYKNNTNKYSKNIIYTGRLVKEKGLLELVRAFNELNDKDVTLIIIGSYDYGAEDERGFIKEFEALVNSNDRIKTTGYIENDKIHKYYSKASFGVVPSIVNEAFGLSALEMMASGLPVIISDAEGLKEVVGDDAGIIVNRKNLQNGLREAMKKLLSNDALLKNMSEKATERSKQFSKDNYVENFRKYILDSNE